MSRADAMQAREANPDDAPAIARLMGTLGYPRSPRASSRRLLAIFGELGLDHDELRFWRGWHHHLTPRDHGDHRPPFPGAPPVAPERERKGRHNEQSRPRPSSRSRR